MKIKAFVLAVLIMSCNNSTKEDKEVIENPKLIWAKYIEFLPEQNDPFRVRTHSNTAFGLSFAYDYVETLSYFVKMI